MKPIMLLIGIMFLSSCGTSSQDTNGNEHVESKEIMAPSLNLAEFATKLDVNATSENVKYTILFTNNSEEIANLLFSSGQKFEIVVENSIGDEVYRYSKGKMFTMALETQRIKPGETISFEDEWNFVTNDKRLETGEYKVFATVIPSEINTMSIEKGTFRSEGFFSITETDEKDKLEQSNDNSAFRNIQVSGENGEYVIKGEVRVFEAVFMYVVEDGHNELISETPFQANEGAPTWSKFELKLSVEKEKLPTNGTISAHLFERSANDGSIVNSYYVPLERIK